MEKQVKIMKKKNRKADEIFTKQLKKNILSMVKIDDFKTNYESIGKEMHTLMKKLYPICRSITGDGVRETLKIIKQIIPIEIKEVPTGTKVFDWTVPKEWNIKDAYIKNSKGKKIVDFKNSNLHVISYSIPIKKKMNLSELKKHLYTIKEHPDWIPYITSYYKENWGFCITYNQYKKLKEDEYEVVIDSTLGNGFLTYGELYIKGTTEDEVLISCYLCHPSLCNDNLSGVVLTTFLAQMLLRMDLRYSYRFLFIPETIGAITWLSQNEDKIHNIKCGFAVTCVGDQGKLTYKKTREKESYINTLVEKVLIDSGHPYKIIDFFPTGSDERQFSSPGFNLHIGSLMRTPYGQFPEYHTSADNLDFVGAPYLSDTLEKYMDIFYVLENNTTYISLNPKCEPQLGRRGLYRMIAGQKTEDKSDKAFLSEAAMLWILNMTDGKHSLLDIAVRSGLHFDQIKTAADNLFKVDLLAVVKEGKDK